MVAWVSLEVWAGARFSLWMPDLATDTVLWFVTAGLVLFGSVTNVGSEQHFFRTKALATMRVTAVVQGYVSLVTFPLVVELLLQPIAGLLGAMSFVASMRDEYRPMRRVVSGVIGLVGLSLLIYVTATLLVTWHGSDKPALMRQLGLPLWLTIGAVPFIYVLALYATYESAFTRLALAARNGATRPIYVRLALLVGFNFHVHDLGNFYGPWPERLLSARSFPDARGVIRRFRKTQRSP
jgi:hypothetical protein